MPWQTRFQQLDAFLLRHHALWHPQPFAVRSLPWESIYPDVSAWLRKRPLDQADIRQADLHLLDAPASFRELARQARELGHLTRFESKALSTNPHMSRDIPGRKWAQIQAFASTLSFTTRPSHWLDWCAGKGYLGHLLGSEGVATTCLEWDADLVESGLALARLLRQETAHCCVDVMNDAVLTEISAVHTPVALHACGDLHVRLIDVAAHAGCRQLAIAPCCYNRTRHPCYLKLSAIAKASGLNLDKDDLSLIQREAVTASPRIRRQRDQTMAWRLGFDLLQRELRGVDAYLPVPPFGVEWLKQSFAGFCMHIAALKGLPAPAPRDWDVLEAQGWARLAEVRNLELMRAIFRRPLEIWLLLDRVMRLDELGYDVRLGEFCESDLTPRNVLILAERKSEAGCPLRFGY